MNVNAVTVNVPAPLALYLSSGLGAADLVSQKDGSPCPPQKAPGTRQRQRRRDRRRGGR